MKKMIFALFATSVVAFSPACQTSKNGVLPLSRSVEVDDAYTIVWDGISRAYRYENGQWVRAETYDYRFTVVQRRYENLWKSIKTIHRVHPDYDGKAGDRDQAMYFEVAYQNLVNGKVQAKINSSLGNGLGTTDAEFRNSVLTMYVPNPSKFIPYNKFRITQNYHYEEGRLTETVELIKEKDGQETLFMKNEEVALIYLKGKLDKAPTIFKK